MAKLLFMSSFPFQYENPPQKRRSPSAGILETGENEPAAGQWQLRKNGKKCLPFSRK